MSYIYDYRVTVFPVDELKELDIWLNTLGREGFRIVSLENYTKNSETFTKCVMTRSKPSFNSVPIQLQKPQTSQPNQPRDFEKNWEIFPDSQQVSSRQSNQPRDFDKEKDFPF